MPYDPNWPQDGDLADPIRFREQFGGLKNFIDAVPGIAGVVIDSVTTLPPGEAATVDASITAGVLHLSFGLPQGLQGAQGIQGEQGSLGATGPMGSVTPQNLDDAIVTTARNPNAIPPFTGTFSDPPTQAEMVAFAAHMETLRAALVR